MPYRQLLEHCFIKGVPVNTNALQAQLDHLAPAFTAVRERRLAQATPLLDLPFRQADLAPLEELAEVLRSRFRHVVVAGTGGSGLSGKMLLGLKPFLQSPAFYFLDNIDPEPMDALLAQLDIEHSCFLIISKSGSTAETLSQFYVLLEHVLQVKGKQGARERFVVITMPGDSPMRRTAQAHSLLVLDHEPDIGGRFSALTKVGLLAAAIGGLDIRALRRGAQAVVEQVDHASQAHECPPALGAALQHAFLLQHYPITVMLPYCERLNMFSAWYRQCWAESLGKAGKGSTPIRAVGTTDQHSQLQLYLDGPKDKLFHMILLERAGLGRPIPAPADADVAYLRGKTLGDIMQAEQEATLETLIRNGCPVRVFRLHQLAEEQLGALLMHFTLEIIFMSFLLDVNPFDQPAVEEGKQLAREALLKTL